MSEINNLCLELQEHDLRGHTATIRVSYKINFSLAERHIDDFRFKEKIQLWGMEETHNDAFLYEFASSIIYVGDNEKLTRERHITVRDDAAEYEAWWRPTREVYAKVWITPLLPESDYKKSNSIEMQF